MVSESTEEYGLRIVQEEVREVLELEGVEVLLELADDRAERLGLGQHLDLDRELKVGKNCVLI